MPIPRSALVALSFALIGLFTTAAEEGTKRQASSEKKPIARSEPKVWTNEDLKRLFGSGGKVGTENPDAVGLQGTATSDAPTARTPPATVEGDQRKAGEKDLRLAEAEENADKARERVGKLEEKVANERSDAMRRLRSRRVVAPSQGELEQAQKELRDALEELEQLGTSSD